MSHSATIGGVVEPGRHLGIAVHVMDPGLTQQGVPGECPVVDEQVPDDACDDQKKQHQRHQKFAYLFHKNYSVSRESHRIIHHIRNKVKSAPKPLQFPNILHTYVNHVIRVFIQYRHKRKCPILTGWGGEITF